MKMKEFQSRLHFRKGDMKVQRYCSKISLHGLQYMTDPDVGIWQKIFWAIAFLIFLSLLIILTQNLQREFLERNTKVELEDSNAPLDEVKFPGVVICSGNQLRKSFIWSEIIRVVNDSGFLYLFRSGWKWEFYSYWKLFREINSLVTSLV